MAAVRSDPGEVFMASDGNGYTWNELSQLIARAIGRKALKISIPIWMSGIVAEFAEIWAAMNGKIATVNREKARELRAPGWVCSIKKAEEKLGFKPEYDAKKGIEVTARWYKQNGWL